MVYCTVVNDTDFLDETVTADMHSIKDYVATFCMDYRISLTRHPSEESRCFETIVPLIRRTA